MQPFKYTEVINANTNKLNMKTLKKVFWLLGLGMMVFTSCDKTPVVPAERKSGVENIQEEFTEYRNELKEYHNFNASDYVNWVSNKGSTVLIQQNAFLDEYGSPYFGSVHMEFIDIYEPKDMILSNRPTITTDGRMLETSGEFMLNFTGDNGQALKPRSNTVVIQSAPDFTVIGNMQAFRGEFDVDSNFTWEEDDSSLVVEEIDSNSQSITNWFTVNAWEYGLNWMNCDQYIDAPNGFTKPEVVCDTSFISNCVVYAYDKTVNSVVPMKKYLTSGGDLIVTLNDWYNGIPIGNDVDFVFIGNKNDVYYYHHIVNGSLTDGTRVTVNPQEKTWEEIELLLEAL